MSSNFTLTGTENLKEIFRQFPEGGYRAPLNAAFRKAADPVKRAMISNLPSNLKALKRIVKAKTSRASKGEPSLAVGFFNRQNLVFRNSRGINWDPYTIAYWHNYGTMARRYSGHSFITPRKSKTSRREGGVRPLLFAEKGWEQSQSQAQKIFEEEVDREICKFYQKYAAK